MAPQLTANKQSNRASVGRNRELHLYLLHASTLSSVDRQNILGRKGNRTLIHDAVPIGEQHITLSNDALDGRAHDVRRTVSADPRNLYPKAFTAWTPGHLESLHTDLDVRPYFHLQQFCH